MSPLPSHSSCALALRSSLSILPTPLHRLDRLSRDLGVSIFCKRDDLSGFAFGGNKTRKLDYLLIDAEAQGVDTVIAVGACQSNFCRVAAAAGAVRGYEVHLVLGGPGAGSHAGNLYLDSLFGAAIHYVDSEDWGVWEAEALRLEKDLASKGRRVYALPVGGSTPVGALGYVNAMCEIMEDSLRMRAAFDVIVHATSSGGTQAGLLVGRALTGWKGVIMGVGVTKHSKTLQDEVLDLAQRTARVFEVEVHRPDVIIDETHQGAGYGRRTEQAEEAIRMFATREGILLDHVYTGKAAAALVEYCRKGRFEKGQNVLFLHTGGNAELFA